MLPRELRDYIYEIAFGIQPRTVKVVTREKWECREEQLSEQRKKYRYMGGYYASRKVLKVSTLPSYIFWGIIMRADTLFSSQPFSRRIR